MSRLQRAIQGSPNLLVRKHAWGVLQVQEIADAVRRRGSLLPHVPWSAYSEESLLLGENVGQVAQGQVQTW